MNKRLWLKNIESSLGQKKTKFSIGLLLLLVSLLPNNSYAQVVIQPQPYISSNGTTVGAVKCNPDGTAALPCYSWASEPSSGFYRNAAGDIRISVLNGDTMKWQNNGSVTFVAGGTLNFGSSGVATPDAFIYRSAVKTLKIDTDGAGGALTQITIETPTLANDIGNLLVNASAGNLQLSGNQVLFAIGGLNKWGINSLNNFVSFSDNSFDIGALGASRPRSIYSGTSFITDANGAFVFSTRAAITSSAAKLIQLDDITQSTGLEFNSGTPTLGTCVGGTLTSGSHNSAGEVTGNTSGSCIINFGTPNFTNTPFCTINDESALIAVQISARSQSSMTVTGAASGNNFQWICVGRIGT